MNVSSKTCVGYLLLLSWHIWIKALWSQWICKQIHSRTLQHVDAFLLEKWHECLKLCHLPWSYECGQHARVSLQSVAFFSPNTCSVQTQWGVNIGNRVSWLNVAKHNFSTLRSCFLLSFNYLVLHECYWYVCSNVAAFTKLELLTWW